MVARKKLPYLDNLLAKNQYVTGSLSYVDVVVFDFSLMVSVFAPEMLAEHPNIARHFKTINSLPQIQNYRNGKGKGRFDCLILTFHLIQCIFLKLTIFFNHFQVFGRNDCFICQALRLKEKFKDLLDQRLMVTSARRIRVLESTRVFCLKFQ